MPLEARFRTDERSGMFVGWHKVKVFSIPPARRLDMSALSHGGASMSKN